MEKKEKKKKMVAETFPSQISHPIPPLGLLGSTSPTIPSSARLEGLARHDYIWA